MIFENLKGKYFTFEKSISLKSPFENKVTVVPDLFSNLIPASQTYDSIHKIELNREFVELDNSTIKTLNFENKEIRNVSNQIVLEKNSSLIFKNCKVDLKDLLILAKGVNSILFYDCPSIKFENVNIKNVSNFINDTLNLPSALTFLKSKVEIINSQFQSNQRGDDFINFYKSDFQISNSLFKNILADAIDSDFSEGVIDNSSFINIGNDAVDTSGSSVNVTNSFFTRIDDKAFSVGENSLCLSQNNSFFNNGLGLVVKDGSELISCNDDFKNNSVDISLFQKKDFYDLPMLFIDNYLDSLNYLIEKKIKIISLDSLKILRTKKVEDMMYGRFYGKSS